MEDMNIKDLTHRCRSEPGDELSFRHQLLVAMPSLKSDCFSKSVVYLCAHSAAGAMGIVINQQLPQIKFKELLEQLNMPLPHMRIDPVIHFGGPVETGRGFVLHSTDFLRDDTVRINEGLGITGTVDILQAIAQGHGPHKSIFALGYAGWGPGQLDAEICANAWLTVPADDDLIFNPNLADKWGRALHKMGVNPMALSFDAGHA